MQHVLSELVQRPDAKLRGPPPGGLKANRRQFEPSVEWRQRPAPALEALLFDPQTSGGLFLLVPEAEAEALEASLPGARIVGQVREPGARPLVVS